MENKRALIFAAICFLISILLINLYLQAKRAEITAAFGDEVDVVVATKDIPEYATITPDSVEVIKVFKRFKQPRSAPKIEDVIGKSAYVAISAREQVSFTNLVYQDGKPVLDRQVEKKMRAVTLLIAPHTGVGRLIRPGNHIDILAVPSYDLKGQTIFEVKTMVQNALVLATGRNVANEVPPRVSRRVLTQIQAEFERSRRKDYFGAPELLTTSRPTGDYTNITVQLTPEDAERILFLTNSFGDRSLYFTLRNASDTSADAIPTTLLDDVLGPESDYGKTKIKPPPVVPVKPRFQDIIGGQVKDVY